MTAGATCLFAYLYVRPLIRKRLGSASRGYINWGSVYIGWLISAVFYHMPSLQSMGVDVKADISLLLTVFLLSLAILGVLQGGYELAVLFKLVDPWLAVEGGAREAWAIVVLNSMTLALACSTYYNFCGNAGNRGAGSSAGGAGAGAAAPLKELVCRRWLPPVTTFQHPAFSSWVLYGESGSAGAVEAVGAVGSNATCPAESLGRANLSSGEGGFCLEGLGASQPEYAGHIISPVFTMWLTLVMMFGVNCLVEHHVASVIQAAQCSGHLLGAERRARSAARHSLRRRSADYSYDVARSQRDLEPRNSMEALFNAVCDTLPGNIWSPTTGALRAASNRLLNWRDDSLVGLAALAREYTGRWPHAAPQPVKLVIPADAAQPSFLPMFPWYSGTSADLLKTLFDLLVSVKLFLGRFDMRTLQAATGTLGNGPDPIPQDGDGFTYEHLARREELWFDFCADTGDGGDPTYAVARCMAAPQIQVTLPDELVPEDKKAPKNGSRRSGVSKTLPRAELLVHGGDLAYPNPTDETYVQRLFKPYEAAFPPPSHVHPGHLVVNKPDLPPQYWEGEGPSSCKCALPPHCGLHNGAEQQRQCKLCQKADALRAYEGPSCFMLPGNHDWIDGLETFQRHVQHKGWIGGWLLPQEKSYFALRLPHGWWLFGLDLALVDDIDMCQYRYFARVAEDRMGPDDQAIVAMHCPTWLVDWFWGSEKCKNLRQLIRGPLRGRARVGLAGDLHFFMRHSFTPYSATAASPSLAPSVAPSELSTPAGSSPRGLSPPSSRPSTPTPGLRGYMSPSQLHQSLVSRIAGWTDSGKGAPAGASPVQPAALGGAPAAGLPQQQHQITQQQQQPQQLVFGRSMDMDTFLAGSSPTGSSPLGGSPLGSHMLLDAAADDSSPSVTSGGSEQQQGGRCGPRWSVAASLAASVPWRRSQGFATPPSVGNGTRSAAPAAGAAGGAATLVHGIGSDGGEPEADNRSRMLPLGEESSEEALGQGPGKALSVPVPIAGGSQSRGMLPILSPIHGSQLELAALGGEVQQRRSSVNGGFAAAPSLGAAAGSASPVHAGLASGAAVKAQLVRQLSNGTNQYLQQQQQQHAMLPPRYPEPVPGMGDGAAASTGSSPTGPALPPAPAAGSLASSLTNSLAGASPFGGSWWPSLRPKSRGELARQASDASQAAGNNGKRQESGHVPESPADIPEGWHLSDPEHLVVSGSGGGFLHPTHVFSYSRFRPIHDPAAGPVFMKAAADARQSKGDTTAGIGGVPRRRTPSSSSLYSLSHLEAEEAAAAHAAAKPLGGEYRCERAFPAPEQSLRLGRRNLHMFRMTNNRFDIIGGMLYYLLVVSVLPRCTGMGEILDAGTVLEGVCLFVQAGWDTVTTILLQSHVSVAVLALLFLMCLGFARSGGIGAMDGVPPSLRRRPEFHGSSMAVRARTGGFATQLAFALAHSLAHLLSAVSLLLLLELGLETVMRYENVGRDGYHSLYKWYRAFEALHFPDPMGLRLVLERWTLHLYPNAIKWLMAVFDVPENIAVSRTAICAAGGKLLHLTRIQAVGFYLGVLAYYWLLATPTVGFLFGCYLFLSVNVFHVHYDEAFSSLQVPHFKGFCRFHITRSGDLEMYSLGLHKVPFSWREDPRWLTPQGGGSKDTPSHKAKWLPVEERLVGAPRRNGGLKAATPPEASLKVVDYLFVPRYRNAAGQQPGLPGQPQQPGQGLAQSR
ncbi:hypothetical protein N2152v2_009236 [Parachlorella kessleri]